VTRGIIRLITCAAGLCLAATPALSQQSGGQLDASPSLFAVLAAINAAGYDAELNSPTTHPLRHQIRQAIAQRSPKSLERIRRFYEAHRREDATSDLRQYVSFALTVDGPPLFQPKFPPNRMPPDAVALEGLGELLVEFCREANLDELWAKAQPAFDEAIARYHEPVTNAILEANVYLRNPTNGMSGRRFQIYIDLLGAPNQVHARSFGDEYFVVVTPSAQPRVKDIRRAYLHYLLDPLAIRNALIIDKKKDICDLARAAPALSEIYQTDCVLLAGMSLVKAVESRLERASGPAMVDQAMKEGFVFTAYFAEALQRYEKQEQSLRLYLPGMMEAIDPVKEDQRIAGVHFAARPAVKTVKTAPPPALELTEADKTLNAAEEQYRQKNFGPAKELFRQALQMQAANSKRAKASFGLARIAALEKDPELAQQLFERTLELDPEPFERAWSYVYLARLAVAAGEPETARKQYQAALAVPGASEGARKAAEQELQKLDRLNQP
jgi:tetratricopeptide (TPR) repeat protein